VFATNGVEMKKILKLVNSEDKLQYEFLSSALEIIETPPSLISRFTIKVVFGILVIILLISIFGKVDIVASATGKVIPSGRLQTIQPMDEGEILKINVNEGDFVKKGQVLIELNAKIKETDYKETKRVHAVSLLEKDLAIAELNGKDVNEVISKYSKNEFIKPEDIEFQKSLLNSKREEFINKEKSLILSIDQQNSELNLSQNEKNRLEKDLLYWQEEEKVAKRLYDIGNISKLDWKNKEKELFNTKKQLDGIKIKIIQVGQKISEMEKSLLSLKEERNKNILAQIVELDKKISSSNAESVKAEQLFKYQNLVSPVNGTIHGLSSYTIGGILKPAETVITIVPEGTKFIAEVMILNKDIGYVKKGNDVELKLEAFPFQKFGTIKGKVLNISPDVVEIEKVGFVYKATVSLEKIFVNVEGKERLISPGMTLTAEIKTGKRRIIEFFLSPIIKNSDEGFKVR